MLSNSLTKEKEKEALACHKSLLKLDEKTCVSEEGSKEDSQDDLATEASDGAAQECSLQEKELKVQQYFIEKTAIYYAKMCMHDLKLATKLPSVLAAGVIHVTFKIYEQIKKKKLTTIGNLSKLFSVSRMQEDELVEISRIVLQMA